MKEFLRRRWQTIVNIVVSSLLGYGTAYRAYHAWVGSAFDFVEALFFASHLLVVLAVLIRRQHIAMDGNVLHQGVALVAFFSALGFDTDPLVPHSVMDVSAKAVAVIGVVLVIVALLSLGRSFGIMIAVRRVRTGGLYSIVRHPMYLGDVVVTTSFVLANPSIRNLSIYVAATACYVYRAIMEERLLSQLPEYREYMEKVRYRFIPGVF